MEEVSNLRCIKHLLSENCDHEHAQHVKGLSESTYIANHVKKRVRASLDHFDLINKLEISKEVSRWIQEPDVQVVYLALGKPCPFLNLE